MIVPSDRRILFAGIETNRAAQKLIAVWPNVTAEERKDKRSAIIAWAALAGLRVREVRLLWKLLVGNGFVMMDGTVDRDAERYVQGLMLARMPSVFRQRAESVPKKPPAPKKEKAGETL